MLSRTLVQINKKSDVHMYIYSKQLLQLKKLNEKYYTQTFTIFHPDPRTANKIWDAKLIIMKTQDIMEHSRYFRLELLSAEPFLFRSNG
jgi:hypothetical protein